MEKLSFYFKQKIVYVDVKRTNNKNIYLRVKDNQLVVSAPKGTDLFLIKSFVQKHVAKFDDYLTKVKANSLINLQKQYFYFFGQKFFFKVLTGYSKNSVSFVEKKCYLKTSDISNKVLKTTIETFLKKQLLSFVNKRSLWWEKKMNATAHKYRVVNKTSTWGSNNVQRHAISLATALGHYREEVIDYVLVHEISHSFFQDHTRAFWQVVAKFIPNYKELQNTLRADRSL